MNNLGKYALIEVLLEDRNKLCKEFFRLRKNDDGALAKDEKTNQRYEAIIKEKEDKIKQLTYQMAWYRRMYRRSCS